MFVFMTIRTPFQYLVWLSLVAGSTIIQQSCINDEFTRPVRISLTPRINEQYKTNENLSFESGEIVLKEIQFEGKRETGGDYLFSTESGKIFGPGYFYPHPSNHELSYFDLPQGIYTLMKWRFELSEGLIRLENDDDDDEIDSETPGLILHGNYINHNGEKIQIRIELDPFESFECQSQSETGDKKINIISGEIYNADLYFDPFYAFRAISDASLENADYSDDETAPVLLISSYSNEDLYEIILFRLQQSAKIVVR
jgi:hypothetical protein